MGTVNKSSLLARLTILKAINHPSLLALEAQLAAKKGKGKAVGLPELTYDQALDIAFVIHGPRADVVDAAYFNEAGERIHSPKRWMVAVNQWVENMGDDALVKILGSLSDDDTPE